MGSTWWSFRQRVREHRGGVLVGTILALAPLWSFVSKASDVEFLLNFSDSKIGAWAMGHGRVLEVLVMLFGFVVLYVSLRQRAARPYRLPLKNRLQLLLYSSKGLSWRVCDHATLKEGSEERGVATLRVTSTSELPQPLDLYVRCAGRIESVSADFIPDTTQPTEKDRDADLYIYPTEGNMCFLKLLCPKLHPPSCLDIRLKSAGNARIRVWAVKRNPEWRWWRSAWPV